MKAKAQRTKRADSTPDSSRPLPDKISGKRLAEIAGISPQRVSVLRRQGLSPIEIISGVRMGRSGRRVAALPTNGTHAPAPGDEPATLAEAQLSKLSVEVKLKRLELSERRRVLVPLELLETAVNFMVATDRQMLARIMALPLELAAECATESDPVAIEQLLTKHLERVIDQADLAHRRTMHEAGLQLPNVNLLGSAAEVAEQLAKLMHDSASGAADHAGRKDLP